MCWNCRGLGNPATVRELKQPIVADASNIVCLSETKIKVNSISRVTSICRMEGCLAVSAEGKSGGLALMWKEGAKFSIQSYSKFHIDSLVGLDDGTDLRFTGFYGHSDLALRNQASDMLRRTNSSVREGGMDAEKEGGRRKPKTFMNDFSELLEELSLVDIKTRIGWFTWSNNREGLSLVKERLDRFLVSEDIVENMPFIETKVVRQFKSDHDAIFMNTVGSKLRERCVKPKHWLRYDTCWAKEKEAKDIINSVWSKNDRNFMEKVEDVREKLGR
ncbi:reverse transcriptase [Gossypium australe]|uniref:Reverse transcriptase n=1 Tax=Gossypium australe TaxID=47621 RepID=A0A5B6VMY7_9ROSI|nr:reverse transcriptase [Gossypium australe]